jgi:UDP-N-acetylglucosamine 2-epimerase (non-hydrolysing)
MTVVGTRPEIIRLSRVIARLDAVTDHVLVHTGQNYDHQLNGVFFSELGVRDPDVYLQVDTTSLGSVIADTIRKTEQVLLDERPDAVLILGDTNSSMAAIIAKRMQIAVYHMEAGNRSFDENVPEETNRRIVDHIADFNLPYTEHARRNLLAEGLHPRRILVTGSPMREVLDYYKPGIDSSTVLEQLHLESSGYFLVSAHRQENVDDPARLRTLLATLDAVQAMWGIPVLVSTHPRTRARMAALSNQSMPNGVQFHEPFGFLDYNKLQQSARCVLSDSGTISEEAAILGFPAITIRDSMERPEALESGTIIMTGLHSDEVIEAISEMTDAPYSGSATLPAEYQISDTSRRVVRFILSTLGRHDEWAGIRRSA